MRARAQVKHLDGVMNLRGDEQVVARHVDGEVIEVADDLRQRCRMDLSEWPVRLVGLSGGHTSKCSDRQH